MPRAKLRPSPSRFVATFPDATPAVVSHYIVGEKERLLAQVRYNRLIDIFFGVIAYPIQSHLRTTVPDMGQVETDEVYVAVRNTGQQFVVPVQAKGGNDQIGAVQVLQDLALCRKRFPDLTPRPVAVQFRQDAAGEVIVMFELVVRDGEIRLRDEKHYRLVPAGEITRDDLARMAAT